MRSLSQLDSWLLASNILFLLVVPIIKSIHSPIFIRRVATAHLVTSDMLFILQPFLPNCTRTSRMMQDANPSRNKMQRMLLWQKENLGFLWSLPTFPTFSEILLSFVESSATPIFKMAKSTSFKDSSSSNAPFLLFSCPP